MPLPFLKCKISSHDGMQLTGMSVSSRLFCCTGMTHWGTHKKQLSLLAFPCLLLCVLSLQQLLPSASFRSSLSPQEKDQTQWSMPEVQDSVSLAQVSNTPCASQPPSSDLGTGLHLGVNQTPSFSALCNPQIASRPLADWLLNRSPNGPYKPYPVSPDNSPNMSCT